MNDEQIKVTTTDIRNEVVAIKDHLLMRKGTLDEMGNSPSAAGVEIVTAARKLGNAIVALDDIIALL